MTGGFGRLDFYQMRASVLLLSLCVAMLLPGRLEVRRGGDATEPQACCCCPAGFCACGCETPAASDDPGDAPARGVFCACDQTPHALPPASSVPPDRLELVALFPPPPPMLAMSPSPRRFSALRAHGPPESLQMLATVILLN